MNIHVADEGVHSRKGDTRSRHRTGVVAAGVVGWAALVHTAGARAGALGEGHTALERRWFDDSRRGSDEGLTSGHAFSWWRWDHGQHWQLMGNVDDGGQLTCPFV